MRIGFDASAVRPHRSGIGHYASSLMDALAHEFPECEFAVLSHVAGLELRAANLIRTQKVSFPIKEIWMQLWLPRILAHLRPDACHFTNGIAPLGLKIPYVVTVHDLSLIRHPEWHPASRRIWMRNILRPSIRNARWVVCDSEATRRDLLAWLPLDAARVSVVALGVRRVFSRVCSDGEKESVCEKYQLRKPYLFYLGNIEPRKNLPLLLEAYRGLDTSEIELVLAGKRAWLWRGFARDVRSGAGRAQVRLLDYVPDRDLPALLQSALAFVYPSGLEGFGLPVLEAMASGTPVVASHIEPLRALVGDAGWLAAPENVREWTEILAEVVKDSERRRTLAMRALERSAGYTWEQTARATMRCYQHALGL